LRMLALNGQAGPQTALQSPVAAATPAVATSGAAAVAESASAAATLNTGIAPNSGSVVSAPQDSAATSIAQNVAAAPAAPAAPAASGTASQRAPQTASDASTTDALRGASSSSAVSASKPAASADSSASDAGVASEAELGAANKPAGPEAASASPDADSSVPASEPSQQAPGQQASAQVQNAASSQSSPALAPSVSAVQDVPPWEDLPEAAGDATSSDAKSPHAAALAVTPATAHTQSKASPRSDEPPAWVDEDIPDDAEGGYMPASEFTADPDDEFETLATSAPAADLAPTPRRSPPPPRRARQSGANVNNMSAAEWPALAAKLPVTGLAAELARQSEWSGVHGDAVVLRVAVKTLAESESRVRLQTVLCEHFGQGLRLEIEVGATGDGTAHAVAQIEKAARQQAAEKAVASDPFVLALKSDFGGQVSAVRAVEPSA